MIGQSIRLICTRFCFAVTDMIQVCSDAHRARVCIINARPGEIRTASPGNFPKDDDLVPGSGGLTEFEPRNLKRIGVRLLPRGCVSSTCRTPPQAFRTHLCVYCTRGVHTCVCVKNSRKRAGHRCKQLPASREPESEPRQFVGLVPQSWGIMPNG